MAVVVFSTTKSNELWDDPEVDGLRVTLGADGAPVAWTYVRWLDYYTCRLVVVVPASIAWNQVTNDYSAEQVKKSVQMIKVNDADDPTALGFYIKNDAKPTLLTNAKIGELSNPDSTEQIIPVFGAVGDLKDKTTREDYRTFIIKILSMSEQDEKVLPTEQTSGTDAAPAPAPAADTAPIATTPPAETKPEASAAKPADAKAVARPRANPTIVAPPPPPPPLPPVPDNIKLARPVGDSATMQKGVSKGQSPPFVLANVYKKGDEFKKNEPSVTLKKRNTRKGDVFNLKCATESFILIPVALAQPLNEAKVHWTTYLKNIGDASKNPTSGFVYVAVTEIEWTFAGNYYTYGGEALPTILLIDYVEAPNTSGFPEGISVISVAKANEKGVKVSPFDAVGTGIMRYLTSNDPTKNPVEIPLCFTQNLNNNMNGFPLTVETTF